MNQDIIKLYDEYTHTEMGRRVFLNRLGKLAGGTALAVAMLPFLENNYAKAATVSKTDSRLEAGYVNYSGAKGSIRAYRARLKGKTAPLPGVVVIHENKGLHPHIEDVTRRIAMEGFIAVAPDALSFLGGTPSDLDDAMKMIKSLDEGDTIKDFMAAVSFLKSHEASSGKVGCIGFCWGGAIANQLAVHSADLKAAVSFYGRQPKALDVPKIKASVLLHYAGLDERINQRISEYSRALEATKVYFQMYIYEGVNHAFHNDTNAARYNQAAAQLAWDRTVQFLKEKLS